MAFCRWDIIAEKFGFMLIFGDVVFIPFTFSIQGWWLLSHSVKISKIAAALNLCIFLFGFAIFRGANKQKHKFKQDSKVVIWGQTAKVIGGRLLASGYWGVARHCNYLGDILVAFSFSLPCGMRYTTLSMPECLTIFDRWFFGHPPGKFLYMSQNLYLFACENHQYSGKIEKLQLVGDFVHFSATKSHAGGY
jgi:protein-S-isoprenylcysteine O-methyltransferase Ste14